MTSIQSALRAAAGSLALSSDSALLDAEILLSLAINKPRPHLRAWPDKQLLPDQWALFSSLLEQRQQGKPIAYITGHREFWSRDFLVTPDVLIPRPDTELLVELSLDLIPADAPYQIIDLGTGSGIIAITLAAERPHTMITATDSNLAALRIAQLNAEQHHINNIRFYHSDWFADLPKHKYHLIISNPPYIAEHDPHLQQGDVRFEPRSALCAPGEGLNDIRTIAENALDYLEPAGHLLIEHGYRQGQQVRNLLTSIRYRNVQTYADLSRQPRATYGQNPR